MISLLHTEIEPAYQGKGLATHLARYSLDDARKRGLGVLPFCPYINSWIKKHPEYTDLVPEDRRGRLRPLSPSPAGTTGPASKQTRRRR